MPQGCSQPASQLRSAQYITSGAITWSPGFSAWNTAVAAAMPEPNSIAAGPAFQRGQHRLGRQVGRADGAAVGILELQLVVGIAQEGCGGMDRRHHAAELRIVGAEPLGELGAGTELGGLDHGGSLGVCHQRFSVVRRVVDPSRRASVVRQPPWDPTRRGFILTRPESCAVGAESVKDGTGWDPRRPGLRRRPVRARGSTGGPNPPQRVEGTSAPVRPGVVRARWRTHQAAGRARAAPPQGSAAPRVDPRPSRSPAVARRSAGRPTRRSQTRGA